MVTFPNKGKIERLELKKEKYTIDTSGKEVVVIILSGGFGIENDFLSRFSVFTESAQGFYTANNGICEIDVPEKAEICLIEAPSDVFVPISFLDTKEFNVGSAGEDNFHRKVVTIISNKNGVKNLIIGETFKKSGNWSSWPPHKHDRFVENQESKQEEVYIYKFKEPSGFGIQLLYEQNIEDAAAHIVTNNQEIKIEKGYHPVVASPSSNMYYLWALFGDNSFFKTFDDQRFVK